jgi:hypothetical protein
MTKEAAFLFLKIDTISGQKWTIFLTLMPIFDCRVLKYLKVRIFKLRFVILIIKKL